MPFHPWSELTSAEITAIGRNDAVVVLPLGAVEQHGPHLPLGTDGMLAEGLLATAEPRISAACVLLPLLTVGASDEHERFPGTLSLGTRGLHDAVLAVGDGVARAGFERLVIINAHGGNGPALGAALLELRRRHAMLAVGTNWMRFGLPEGILTEEERALDVHGGLVETSLMLHLRPDLVRMERAEDFASSQAALSARTHRLRAYGPVAYGWMAGDLNPHGVVGNAAGATAEIGGAIAEHQARAFAELVDEVASADLDGLLHEPGGA